VKHRLAAIIAALTYWWPVWLPVAFVVMFLVALAVTYK